MILEGLPHQKLHTDIIDLLGVRAFFLGLAPQFVEIGPLLDQQRVDSRSYGFIYLRGRRLLKGRVEVQIEIIIDGLPDGSTKQG